MEFEKEMAKPIKEQLKKAFEQEEEDYDVWYACDGCFQPIKEGKFRYDCEVCPNFTLCKTCFSKNKKHLHTFKKEMTKY